MSLVNRIRRSLNILWTGEDLEQKPDEGHSSSESQHAAPAVIRAELHLPQSVIDQYTTDREKKNKNETWRRRTEIITLATEFVGVILLLANLLVTREAVKVAVDGVRTDKRAWVSPGDIQILNKPETGKPLNIKVGIKNSGESPAVHLFTADRLALLKSAKGDLPQVPFSDHVDLASCIGPKPKWEDVSGGAILIPGSDAMSLSKSSDPLPETYMAIVRKGQSSNLPFQDLKGQEEFNTIPTAPNTPPETKFWQIGLYYVGCINYFDAFREAHRTSFCYVFLIDPATETVESMGTFHVCKYGNEAD